MNKHKEYISKLTKLAAEKSGKIFYDSNLELLHEGHYANAVVYRYHDRQIDCAIKSFGSAMLPVKYTYGFASTHHEYTVLKKLSDIEGMISNVRRLSPHALAMGYVQGVTISDIRKDEARKIPASSFLKLEKLVEQMHSRDIVHLDLRNSSNLLVTDSNDLYMIDFQSSLSTKHMPKPLRKLLEFSDYSGVYKAWSLVGDAPLPPDKQAFLDKFNKIRKLWFLKGYPLKRGINRIKQVFHKQ